MSSRACFRLAAGSLFTVLASGTLAPCAADPHSLSPGAIEQTVISSLPSNDIAPVDASVDEVVQQPEGQWGSTDPAVCEADVPIVMDSAEAEMDRPPVDSAVAELGAAETVALDSDEGDETKRSAGTNADTVIDPWAEAFAESARLGAVPPPPPPPPYPVVVNAQVQRFIDHYTGPNRDIVTMWLSRSQRYVDMIRDVLRAQGLPEDLAFVAMVESGFNPLAVSRAGAKGLWQFMAGTARGYGLRVDRWVDERLDPEKSTAAAAAYLRDLYEQFGSWALAKAAYNAGEVRIVHAIKALGTNDFWAIARSRFLRRETKEFVPAIHAATVIGRDPHRFGFDPAPPPSANTEIVKVPPSTNLRSLGRAAGIRGDTLRRLNPVLVRGITPPGRPYEVKIPAGTRDRVMTALARAKRASARRKSGARPSGGGVHVVRPNDTVSEIAERYGVSVSDVVRWNGLQHPDRIRPGDRLRVAGVRLSAGPRSSGIR